MIAYQLDTFEIVCLANMEIHHAVFNNPNAEGQSIVEYCGVVTGAAFILGANIFRDFSPAFGISSADVFRRV